MGIPKLDLIDIYAQMGFPYYDLTMDELDKELETFCSLKEAPINQPTDKPSAILETAREKYMQKNPMTMKEIEQEIQDYRKEEPSGLTGMLRFLEQFDHGEVVTTPQKNMKMMKPNLRMTKSVKCLVFNTSRKESPL